MHKKERANKKKKLKHSKQKQKREPECVVLVQKSGIKRQIGQFHPQNCRAIRVSFSQ